MAFGSLGAFTLGAWQGSVAVMLGGPAADRAGRGRDRVVLRGPRRRERLLPPLRELGRARLLPAGPTCSRSPRSSVPATGACRALDARAGSQGAVDRAASGQLVWEVIDEDSDERRLREVATASRSAWPTSTRRSATSAASSCTRAAGWSRPTRTGSGARRCGAVEVESTPFVERYDLRAADRPGRVDGCASCSSPSLVSWLAEPPARARVRAEGGDARGVRAAAAARTRATSPT